MVFGKHLLNELTNKYLWGHACLFVFLSNTMHFPYKVLSSEWHSLQIYSQNVVVGEKGLGSVCSNAGGSAHWVSSVQFSHSVVSDSLRPHGLQHARLPITNSITNFEFTQTHVYWVSNAIQPSYPLSSPSPPAPNPSSIRVFLNESALRIRWLKYWSFSFNISPSNE